MKLDPSQLPRMKRRYEQGVTSKEIARQFEVTRQYVNMLAIKHGWKRK